MLDRLRFSFDERSILILGLALIILPILIEVSGFRLTSRMGSGKDLMNQSPIGEIIRQKRAVRKRGEASISFSSVNPGDALFVGDRILTGKGASARVHLTDGNLLELGPESLIRIEPVRTLGFGGVKRKIKITLESGTVKAAVRPDGAPVVVENTRGEVIFEALPPPPPPIPIPLSAPEPPPQFISAELPEPEKTEEAKSTLVTLPRVDTSESPEAEKSIPVVQERPLLSRLTLALRPPVEEIRILSAPGSGPLSSDLPISEQNFSFKWKSLGYGRLSPYRVRVRDSGSENIIETERENVELPIPLRTASDWEVQIEADMKNGETVRSKPVRFSWSLPPPQAVTPSDQAEFTPDQLRFFSRRFLLGWKEMPACPRFRIEVTRNELSFQSSGQTFETNENFVAMPPPGPGIWKWRITCIFAPGITSSGPVSRFKIPLGDQP